MMTKIEKSICIGKSGRRLFFNFLLTVVSLAAIGAKAENRRENLVVTTNFAGREIADDERIEMTLSRALTAEEGRLAIFIGETDTTALFVFETLDFSYQPTLAPLPAGEISLTIYLVEPGGEWKTLAAFPLKVKKRKTENDAGAAAGDETVSAAEANPVAASGATKIEFTPNVALNVKGQNQTLTFPRDAAPERNPSNDVDGQGNFLFKVSRRGWFLSNKFDFVGVSFRSNALRFGELQQKAPMIDLSSYLVEFGRGRFKVNLGHVSFGSNRHLINNFSSRGITVTVPIGEQNDVSFSAANGTSVVGFDNFLGVSRRKHSVVSAVFAREFFKERPNGLRLEFSVLRGSLLPLSNFNQGEINDAEKSLGFGFRVVGSNRRQRLRYEAGFTRSRFTNPNDPQLQQNFDLTEIRPATKDARYGEISFDFFRGLKLWKEKKLKATATLRHEEIQPLFRSVAASTQADRRQNQFEITANFGEMNFAYGNLRDRDNLNEIASILKTLNRRNNLIFGVALNSFFTPDKPKKWLPQVSYAFDRTHQFGAFLPVNGEFRDLSQVPDQQNRVHTFNAQWQISGKFNVGFRCNRAFQDNRQPGREQADFSSAASAVTLGAKLHENLDLDFDLSEERQKNFEQPRVDRTFRFAARAVWRTPFLVNSVFSASLSTALAGDADNLNDSRNAEFDAQWAYKFGFGSKKFKKLEAQFFIRYANRYGDTIDRLFFINNFNKTQVFNIGLNFNVF